MAELIPQLAFQPVDADGAVYPGGKLFSYVANTSTPKATYTDETGDTEHTNPVVLDADGRAVIYMDGTSYKFILKDSNDVEIKTWDNIQGAQAATLSANIVSNSKLAQMAESTIKGRAASAGTGDPQDLTAAQVKTLLALSGSDITNTPSGNLASANVQLALNELQGDIDVLDTDLSTAESDIDDLELALPSGDDYLQLEELAAKPAAPAAGYKRLYAGQDGKVYQLNSDDEESEVGSGGGGGAGMELYLGQSNAPIESVLSNGRRVLDFSNTDEQEIFVELKVPTSYVAGTQIKLAGGRLFAALTSGNVLFRATSYLFKAGIDGTSTPTGYASTNTQVAVAGSTNQEVAIGDIDCSNSSGEINSVAVAAGNTILVKLIRKTSSETSGLAGDARLVRSSFEPQFS